ncbi:hypothetical protein [Sedimenticola sp.]|uniref:hypothetical protein n=1 Tax=Sedimenticola sp. TaxID=1940285 RepID=UPI003D15329E
MLFRKTAILALFLLLTLAGCASVQELRDRRITENQGLFDAFPVAIQEQVRQGRVEIGFTGDMVRLAWGEPDQVFTRTTREKRATVWGYTRIRHTPQLDRMSIPVYYLDSNGQQRVTFRSVWINSETREAYTVARVEFVDGQVSAIEQLQRDEDGL